MQACYHYYECGPSAVDGRKESRGGGINQSNFYSNVKASGGFHNFSAQALDAQVAKVGGCPALSASHGA